jgi:type I restriction enzyme S subunit
MKEVKQFGCLAVVQGGFAFKSTDFGYGSDDGVPVVRMSNLKDGILCLNEAARVNREIVAGLDRFALKSGDYLFGMTGSLGNFSVVRESDLPCFLNQRVGRLIKKDGHLAYAAQLFRSTTFQTRLVQSAAGAAQANLSADDIECIDVFAPPLPEQRKIADILTTWDEALTQLDALIEAQERRKKALMQQLLTGKKRFPGFKGKWKTVSLGDVLDPIARPTAKPQGNFLAAGIRSHGKGVFLKHDFISANIALDELFELKTGDLVVNITFAWEGAAAIVPPEADGALVSHRFPAFGFREGKAAQPFFRHYIRTHRFVFDCGLASPGGAGRNRVLSKSAFLDIELPLPPIEEQQKIGDILDTADQQLTLLRTQRTALDQQKRGLMQRLLTGKMRVAN